jgi:hypothetical protein
MDVGNKTLAQLSQDGKEKQYVTIEVGSKISGYTKDYLERLCRLNKVEYRIWNNGQFVIELESLLNETHTILLSYEGVTFVEKKELTDPIPQIVGNILSSALSSIGERPAPAVAIPHAFSQDTGDGGPEVVPRFGEAHDAQVPENSPASFSYIGRSVVSDLSKKDVVPDEVRTPVSPSPEQKPTQLRPVVAVHATTEKPHQSVHIPILGEHAQQRPASVSATPLNPAESSTHHSSPVVHLHVTSERETPPSAPVVAPKEKPLDEWDTMIIHGTAPDVATHSTPSVAVPPPPPLPASQYRPIATSLDASEHHDPAPLFPVLSSAVKPSEATPPPTPPMPVAPPVVIETHPGIPDLGANKRVVVFGGAEEAVAPSPLATPVAVSQISKPVIAPRPSQSPARQSPSALALESEHHLLLREKHPMMKSVGFNLAFGILFVGSSLWLIDGLINNASVQFLSGGQDSFLASVGVVSSDAPEVPTSSLVESYSSDERVLPFSDAIEVSDGATSGSVVIQPVFREDVGGAYEYHITPVGTSIPPSLP